MYICISICIYTYIYIYIYIYIHRRVSLFFVLHQLKYGFTGADITKHFITRKCVTYMIHCNTLEHTATHCNTLQHTQHIEYTATHCNRTVGHRGGMWGLLHSVVRHSKCVTYILLCNTLQHTATHCNTLQHTATHCSTLQHTETHCSTLQHTATHCNTLQHTATHCNTLQHTAVHCSALQRTATHLQHCIVRHNRHYNALHIEVVYDEVCGGFD